MQMNTKTVIITGSNSGIGKAAAKIFAAEGYRVIMACRSIERSERARTEIIGASGNDAVDLLHLDVSSFESIRSFCTEYRSRFQKLDVLIHNAAYFNHGEKVFQFSPDKIELTWATNTFGPFLMTQLLKDLLARSDDPRILTASTTNIKHFFDPKRALELDNLHGELKDRRKYDVYKLYGDSKMASLMLTFRLAEVYKPDGIKVNAVMIPNIRQEKESLKKFKSYYRVIAILQNIIARSPERMADTYYNICTSDAFREVTGKPINIDNRIMERTQLPPGQGGFRLIKELLGADYYPRYAEEKEVIDKVWEKCNELTSSISGGSVVK
jgi:NAD(P)-dependent dehydrogenase (short-subunit alcohol dehydrogenase family)